MPVATFVMATALVALAGFATQRGTICAVQAGRDVADRRSWARFVSFLECAAWSALIFIAVMAKGVLRISLHYHTRFSYFQRSHHYGYIFASRP